MKLSERQVYVVTGSEDGMLGVYSNVKLAWEKAKRYLGGIPVKDGGSLIGSYPHAVKGMQESGYYLAGAGQMTAEIRCFNLNAL